MNVREPDWSYVGRSLLKLLAVGVVLFMALNLVEGFLRANVDLGQWRAAEIRATADRIANPERRLDTWPDSSRLTDAIDWIGLTSRADAKVIGDQEANKEARTTIGRLPQTLDALAVVHFAHPMTTGQLVAFQRRHEFCGGADVSYVYALGYYDSSGPNPPTNRVVWNRDLADEHGGNGPQYQCETEPQIALAAFRRWAELLNEDDDLSEFDLYDWWLAGAAHEGVVYRLVLDRWKVAELLPLLGDPEVRTIRLADVAFDLGEIR